MMCIQWGKVFLYIEVTEITIKNIYVFIMNQTENDSDPKKSYDLVQDITNGELIFDMLRFYQDERISSNQVSQKLLNK
jgi:hypothetical protein